MICDKHKCIFVHIPKTGGTSVENLVWGSDWSQRTTEQLWMGNVRPGFNKYQSGGLQHLLAHQILQEVGQERFQSYFKFSFVRNPWAKTVSQFKYIKTRPMLLKYMGLGRFSSFRRYVTVLQEHKEKHVQSFEQWKFLYDENGQLLVDFLGRFETLQQDFESVAETIGLTDSALPHDMKSVKRRPYQSYYNKKLIELVGTIYEKDVELFNYRFE